MTARWVVGRIGLLPQSPRSCHSTVSISPLRLSSLRTGVASVISVPWVWDKVHAWGKTDMESTVPGPLEVSRSGGGGGLQGQSAGSNLQPPGTRLRPQSFQRVSS